MSKLSLEEINSRYPDVLSEIGNIGAGNAATAISSMLNHRIDIGVPEVRLVAVEKIGASVGHEDDVIVGIMLGVEHDIEGSMMFLIDMKSAKHMINHLMMRDPEHDVEFDEIELSAIREVGNIIAGAYLNAIAGLTNLCITPTVPYVTIDMAAAILSVPAIQFGMSGDYALMINTQISSEMDIKGSFILMPEGNSYEKIFSSLGIEL